MTKKVLISAILLLCSALLVAIIFADLDIDSQYLVKDFVIDYDVEITESNFNSLEGLKYSIVYEVEEYIILEVDGQLIIINKDQ